MIDLPAPGSADFQMWVTFAVILVAFAFYVLEWLSMEMTSLAVICVLLVFFHFFPVLHADGSNQLDPARILHGFSNPALISVLALLVIGQGMVRTGVLDRCARFILGLGRKRGGPFLALVVSLATVMVFSAFLNNIPVVVIFIPIMQALAARFGRSAGTLMIPLSYAAVFGGMTTLIGSGTNLLVNTALIEMDERPFDFFDFTVPGVFLAGVGFAYILFVAPRLLPGRSGMADRLLEGEGKQFLAQITVSGDSNLIGERSLGGYFRGLPDMTVRMIQRAEEAYLPPFEDIAVQTGDVLVVAATRKALRTALAADPGLLHPDLGDGRESGRPGSPWQAGEQVLAEVMVAPASRMIGQTLPQIGFRYKTHCIVLGIQRRSRMIRARITDIRLQAGDVLLVQGQPEDIAHLKDNRDVVLIEWSQEELPALHHATRALVIFGLVVGFAATGVLPIVVSALAGAAAMVAFEVLNLRQAFRAIDPKIVTTIAAALALGVALQETGGAQYLAHGVLGLFGGASPTVILSLFFLLISALTNVVSEKTCAVLFTPIAVDLARQLGIPPEAFAVAVVFAANCSFASPLGYQTNLLVMAPGHYRFVDFLRAGLPLNLLVWIAFSLFIPWYYGF